MKQSNPLRTGQAASGEWKTRDARLLSEQEINPAAAAPSAPRESRRVERQDRQLADSSSVRQLRELQQKLAEVNTLADKLARRLSCRRDARAATAQRITAVVVDLIKKIERLDPSNRS